MDESTSASAIYGGTFLTGKMAKEIGLEGVQKVAKVEKVSFTKKGEDLEQTKIGLTFEKFPEFQLLLNKTNAKVMIAKFGDDFSQWEGKEIKVVIKEVEVSGVPTPVIRLE
ncbi:MAG: hypothetical protein J7K36_01285 [Archaeoglobaceae archaeon]|nr:hypothetical protein [Archaeoglobaceae archaeon]